MTNLPHSAHMDAYCEFSIAAGRRLTGVPADHPCARVHGHTFLVRLTVSGPVHPQTGFVVDFEVVGVPDARDSSASESAVFFAAAAAGLVSAGAPWPTCGGTCVDLDVVSTPESAAPGSAFGPMIPAM